MNIELRHLRTLVAIHEEGGLSRGAERLGLTQSALSHQLKALEGQVGQALFHRRARPMRPTPAGERLLALAHEVLPAVAAAEADFRAIERGRAGRLHIALECHACFDWLLAALDGFRRAWPEVDLDIRQRLAFDAIEALGREEVDLVISSDPADLPGITFSPLFDYAPTLVCAAGHKLAGRPFIVPEDLAGETLLHYPVARDKLDAFAQLLTPAGVEPAATRAVELTEVMLMLVAAGRGVAVLPDWVAQRLAAGRDHARRPLLRPEGITRRMFAATRTADLERPYVGHMIALARRAPARLAAGPGA